MWWVFVFLFIGFYVIIFSIPSFLLWGSSLLIGGLSYIFLKSNFFDSINANVRSDLVTILLTKEDDISFTIDISKIELLIKKYKVNLITWSVTFSFYSLLFLLSIENIQLYLIVNPNDIPKSLGTTGTFSKEAFLIFSFISSVAVISYLFKKLSPDKRLAKVLNNNLQHDINSFKADYQEIKSLNNIIQTIENYSKELTIFFSTSYKSEIQTEINDNKSSIFKDVGLIKKIVSTKIALANSDKNQLEKSTNLYNNFFKFYNKVNVNVLKTNSKSHINHLNHLLELMEENKNQLLINRKWNDFESSINDFLFTLNELNTQAINYIENPIEDEIEKEIEQKIDPYDVLDARREMTNEEIRKKYLEIINKYHSDRLEHLGDEFKIIAERKSKEIIKAWEEIKKERKIK